jgi:hypothetical protein
MDLECLNRIAEALERIAAAAERQGRALPPEAVDLEAAAAFIGVRRETVEQLIRTRRLAHVSTGRQRGRVIPVEALREFLREYRQEAMGVRGRNGCDVDELDPAMLTRFTHVRVVADVRQWLLWARGGGRVHHKVAEFVEASPGIFETPESNPRSWAKVGEFVRAWEENAARPVEALAALVHGQVGRAFGGAFVEFYLGAAQPLKAMDIIDDYPALRGILRQWVRGQKLDLLATTLEGLKRYLERPRPRRLLLQNEADKGNVKAFIADLPAEMRPGFVRWLEQNSLGELADASGKAVAR